MTKRKISITLNEKLLNDVDSLVDNIFIRNRSQAIEHLVSNGIKENKAAVILLGGNEDELRISKTEFCATAMSKGSTLIELAVRKLRENNFKTIFIISRQLLLTKLFEILKDGTEQNVKITYVEEKNSKGSADSLKLLKGKINSSFLVVYGDIYFSKIKIEELWNDHIRGNSVSTIMLTTSPKPSEKGTVKVEGNKVLSFAQKPKKSDIYLVFSPIFAAVPQILDYAGSSLEMDIFPSLAEKGLLNGHFSSEKEIHIHEKKDIEKI